MREELRTYYERELSYLRQLGSEFAAKYPKIASRLALDADGSQDPHVERLIEAVAFLTARIRHKLDDELPEVTDTLLGILYPHYLAPIPSMMVAQFHIDPSQAQLGGGYEIARHTVACVVNEASACRRGSSTRLGSRQLAVRQHLPPEWAHCPACLPSNRIVSERLSCLLWERRRRARPSRRQ